jgi:MscS family membrane protein
MNIDHQAIVFAGNELWRLAALFGVIVVSLICARLGRILLHRSADSFDRHGRKLMGAAMRAVSRSSALIALSVAFPIGLAFLSLGEVVSSITRALQGVLISVAIGFTFYQLVDVVTLWLKKYASRTDCSMNDMLVPIASTSLRVSVVTLTLLQIAQSLTDKPLTSIIAGLGVGGLAVALAAQDTIKHFFGSLVLFADKPFKVGDRIIVDTNDGTVEEVGFRSTRIRTLEGHLVTMPNGDLANKVIVNIEERPYIRHRSIIAVTYDTPPEKITRAVEIISELLQRHEGMVPELPPRVVFDDFASSSLNILMMFWYHPADFWLYKSFLEKLNLKIIEQFNLESITFALPSQTIYVAGNQNPYSIKPPDAPV